MKQETERKRRGWVAEKERKEKLQESRAEDLDKVLPVKGDS